MSRILAASWYAAPVLILQVAGAAVASADRWQAVLCAFLGCLATLAVWVLRATASPGAGVALLGSLAACSANVGVHAEQSGAGLALAAAALAVVSADVDYGGYKAPFALAASLENAVNGLAVPAAVRGIFAARLAAGAAVLSLA